MDTTMQLLCSTGAFSRFPDLTGYQAVLKYGPQLQVDGFELMFFPGWYGNIKWVGQDLQHSQLRFPAMHTEKSIGSALGHADPAERERGVQLLAENCLLGSMLGTKILILHLWNWPDLDNNLENNLSVLSQCLDLVDRYDQKLAIETIPGRHFDPLVNVHRALTCDARCSIALDTEFLAMYNHTEDVFSHSWIWQKNLMQHIHIKDYDGQAFLNGQRRYLHPGEGKINFDQFFAQLKTSHYMGNISLESPALLKDGEVDIPRIQESLDFLRHYVS
ncbi:sugar phosphate isomerase/epimerase family protein [Tengunoibacter tsumagoiensis]|uniref:Xylose isomerase-like TIM barrel domain-containing protein n=1 Tax=Tengunoibacter tsumagoiensis TaxID=2014871 RepID=A0A401ZXS6_9CHLR|nr:sugar phosphate isomerase/epimerase family protein [Tengunoibacter tsumagoiensis]GCE11651.1 hypothetical protein KTT_15100 [Tengunoibacter tsumagoiensis]